jgi:pyridinium-3,5-biscarboxylic acid mononucleotide synthase
MTDQPMPDDRDSDHLLAELRAAIEGRLSNPNPGDARLDYQRASRTGAPEIIYAEHKSAEQVVDYAGRLLERNGSVLVSRASAEALASIQAVFGDLYLEHPQRAGMVRIRKPEFEPVSLAGNVAIFTAGTSDVPRAEEVRLVIEEMGATSRLWADMGVAGIHRLIQPFREAIEWPAAAIVVVAGMDGALPSVIAGLAPIPVIGLPVSVGYGYGGQGEGALMAMLQTCAPGLTVVNIDNSVGAGIAAARIARQSVPS